MGVVGQDCMAVFTCIVHLKTIINPIWVLISHETQRKLKNQNEVSSFFKISNFCVFHPIWMKFGMGADMICEMATAIT